MIWSKLKKMLSNDFRGTIIIAILAIFAIPVACSLVMMQLNINAVEKDIIKTDEIMINTISAYFEKEVASSSAVATAIPNSKHFKEILGRGYFDKNNAEFLSGVYRFATELKNLTAESSAVSDIFVVFNEIDLVVSSSMFESKKNFFDKYYINTDATSELWNEKLGRNMYSQHMIVNNGNQKYIDFFYNQEYGLKRPVPAYVVVIRMSAQKLIDYALDIYDFDKKEMCVIDKNNNVMFRIGDEILENISYDEQSNYPDMKNEKDYMWMSLKSAYNGWKYVLSTDNEYLSEKVQYNKYLAVVNTIIYLIMAILFLCIYIVKNYLPVKKITSMINSSEDVNFKLIENIVSEHNSFRLQIDKYEKKDSEIHQEKFLNNILSLERNRNAVLKEACNLDIKFLSDKFHLMLIDVYDSNSIFEAEEIDDLERISSVEIIVKNIFEELFEKIGCAYVIPKNDKFVCIVNCNNNADNLKKEIREILEFGKSLIEKQFNIYMSVNVGDLCYGIENIHKAYIELNSLYKKSRFIKNKEIVFFDDISNEIPRVICNNELIEKISSFVQLGDFESAMNCITKVADLFAGKEFQLFTVKIINEISSVFPEDDDTKQGIYTFVNKILEFESCDSYIKNFEYLVKYTCDYVNDMECNNNEEIKNPGVNSMLSKIKEYVAEKYSDCSITVAYIGSYVGVTPYYASRIFKESTGENLSDYISRYRIEKAKQFLEQDSRLPISKLYEMVGFGSERTFMRIFCKYEGVTVGQYKKMLKKE